MTANLSVVGEYERVFGMGVSIPWGLSESSISEFLDFLSRCIERGRPMTDSEEDQWFGGNDVIRRDHLTRTSLNSTSFLNTPFPIDRLRRSPESIR